MYADVSECHHRPVIRFDGYGLASVNDRDSSVNLVVIHSLIGATEYVQQSNRVFRIYGVVAGSVIGVVGSWTLAYTLGSWNTLVTSEKFVGLVCGILLLVMGAGCSCLSVMQSARLIAIPSATEDNN